jgi:hypothetical protein
MSPYPPMHQTPHGISPENVFSRWLAAWLVAFLLVTPTLVADEAKDLFDSLFGAQVQRVAKTLGRDDDVVLAAEMIAAAIEAADAVKFALLAADRAYALSSRSTSGIEIAIAAANLIAKLDPTRRLESMRRVIQLRQRQYARLRGLKKREAGERLIEAYMELAAAKQDSGDFVGASSDLRRALTTASTIKSDRRDEIKSEIDVLRSKQQLAVRIKALKLRIMANKQDKVAIALLLKLLVVEMDDPAEARKYTFLSDDDAWKTHVPLAAQELESLKAGDALALGKWYRSLAATAPKTAKLEMLIRSRAAYEKFLEADAGEGLAVAAARIALKTITSDLEKIEAGSSSVTRVNWKKDRITVKYHWSEQTMSKGSYDYSDPDHVLLTDEFFKPTYHSNSVAWHRPAKPSPLMFDFGRRVLPKGIRLYFHGTDAPGGNMAQPTFVRIYRGTKTKPGSLLAKVEPVPDKTGWLEIRLPQRSSAASQYYWILIGASEGKWTLIEEVEFH